LVSADEKPVEQEEVGQDGDDDCVNQHDMRDNFGEERYEGVAGPERREDCEEEEEEPSEFSSEANYYNCSHVFCLNRLLCTTCYLTASRS
jgi:hypothetical protein